MTTTDPTNESTPPVTLEPVSVDNWRDVARLEVTDAQQAHVARPCYYLSLCHYGQLWSPWAIRCQGQVVGMMMWAVDPEDGSCWLGGILVDRGSQGRGIGQAAVRAAIDRLAREQGHRRFALSYHPQNRRAAHVYRKLGFVETGEREDEEVVARLHLDNL